MKRATLALAALVAATVALAQQTPAPTPPEARTSTTPQERTAPRLSETDKLSLMNNCTRLVQAAHPSVPEKDVRTYCESQLKVSSSQRNWL